MGRLSRKRMGCKAFCYEIDLLTVDHHVQGRDVLERKFFGSVDTRGALARDSLLTNGPRSLNHDKRCDFARLLLSLEARRPAIVGQLRDYGTRYLAQAIDNDPEILSEMKKQGVSGSPSEFLNQQGFSFKDKALSSIQKLVDNPKIGDRLINMSWRVIRLGPLDGSLVLSDRPLVRTAGFGHPHESWFLPLDPKAAFCALNDHRGLDGATPHRLAKRLNVVSAQQAERYVFSADNAHTRWLSKYLAT